MCKHQGHNPSGFSFSLALHFFTPLGGEDSPLFARAAQSDAQLGMREPLRLPVTKHFCATWVFSELPYFFVKYKNTTSNTNNAHQEGSYDPATQCGQDLCNTKHQAFCWHLHVGSSLSAPDQPILSYIGCHWAISILCGRLRPSPVVVFPGGA